MNRQLSYATHRPLLPSTALPPEARAVAGGLFTFESLLVLLVLVLSTSGFMNLLPGELGVDTEAEGLPIAQGIWIGVYAITLLLVLRRRKQFWAVATCDWMPWLLTGWALASTLWSLDAAVTARRACALLLTTVFATYFGMRYTLKQQLRLLMICMTVVTFASLIACVLFPSYGIAGITSPDAGSWQGIFSHKNSLGRMMVLGCSVFVLLGMQERRWSKYLALTVASFTLIVMSTAKTSVVFFFVMMGFLWLSRFIQKNPRETMVVLLIALILVASFLYWVFDHWDQFVNLLGKDPTLTGRTALWGLSLVWIYQRPILGYGFAGFWTDSAGPAAILREAVGWKEAPHAHNGILNLWLDLGVVGIVLFWSWYALNLWRAQRLLCSGRHPLLMWPMILMAFVFLYTWPEISIMDRNEILWVLYVATAVGLHSGLRPANTPHSRSIATVPIG